MILTPHNGRSYKSKIEINHFSCYLVTKKGLNKKDTIVSAKPEITVHKDIFLNF